MPTDNRSPESNERYDGHRRSGGRVKRQSKKKFDRRKVNEVMRTTVRDRNAGASTWGDWRGKRGRGD